MQKLLLSILIIVLILVVVEDFRFRKVSLLWLIVILITSFLLQLNTNLHLHNIAANTFLNLCTIAVNYVILTLYFSLKNRRLINLGNHYLGTGDLIFLIAVSFLFSPLNFVCFILLSLFFTLFYSLFAKLILKDKFKTIPLAGLQSMFLILLLTILFTQNKISEVNNDQFALTTLLTYVGYN